jgi:hypothetical protein
MLFPESDQSVGQEQRKNDEESRASAGQSRQNDRSFNHPRNRTPEIREELEIFVGLLFRDLVRAILRLALLASACVSPSADAPSFFMSSGMGSDFRSFLSSFGDGLAGFGGLTRLRLRLICIERQVSIQASKSGLSGFDVTIVVLLIWFPPPGASPGKAWKIVE